MKTILLILSVVNFLAVFYGLSKIVNGDLSEIIFIGVGFNFYVSIFCGKIFFDILKNEN